MALLLINTQTPDLIYRINRDRWQKLFHITRAISWTPLGTLPPQDWPGDKTWNTLDYVSGAGQLVTERDAIGLSSAVTRLIGLLQDTVAEKFEDTFSSAWEPHKHQKWEYLTSVGLNNDRNEFLYSDWMGKKLEELVVFCRQGAFEIHHIDP